MSCGAPQVPALALPPQPSQGDGEITFCGAIEMPASSTLRFDGVTGGWGGGNADRVLPLVVPLQGGRRVAGVGRARCTSSGC